jgi:hypothetical protein
VVGGEVSLERFCVENVLENLVNYASIAKWGRSIRMVSYVTDVTTEEGMKKVT